MLKDGKMSKSSGTSYTVRGLIERGYDPMAFRYLLLTGHYRQPMDFAFESLDAAAAGYKNMVRKIADLMAAGDTEPVNQDLYNEWHDKILSPISDNLKTSETLAVVQDLLKSADINPATKLSLLTFIDDLLGLQLIDRANKLRAAESAVVEFRGKFATCLSRRALHRPYQERPGNGKRSKAPWS